jgi:site-specific recombinase XerD
MSLEGIKKLLELPNTKTRSGRRDLALLSLLYDTAARVQELIDLTPISVRLEKPYTIKFKGKGNNFRIVPLMKPQMLILKSYMSEWNLNKIDYNNNPLFFNKRHEKLTRSGVSYILNKYITKLREQSPIIVPEKFSCHCLRHSKSMHMLQAGVNLIYIRDILGHKSVKTTEIYARADSKQKREAIEKAYTNLMPKIEKSKWDKNDDLLKWLNNFDK